MINLQCDKNFIKILTRFFEILNISVKAGEFADKPSDMCFLRNIEDIPPKFRPESKYIIANSDDKEILKLLKYSKTKIITCGMSTRSTVTFSSIYEKTGVVCLQRSVKSLNSLKISPFELPFELCGKIIDEISVLMLVIAGLICGADVNLLKKINL